MNCPTCGQTVRDVIYAELTARELDVLSAWWHVRTVKRAALLLGISEQRAKNHLQRARIRNGVHTTERLAALYIDRLRSPEQLVKSHNRSRSAAA